MTSPSLIVEHATEAAGEVCLVAAGIARLWSAGEREKPRLIRLRAAERAPFEAAAMEHVTAEGGLVPNGLLWVEIYRRIMLAY